MLKSQKPFPNYRPLTRLQFAIQLGKNNKKGVIQSLRPESLKNPYRKAKFFDKSASKQNNRPKANVYTSKLKNRGLKINIQLPLINNQKILNEESPIGKKGIEDFESYCAKGHTVFVDQRDAGVKLGHWKQNNESRRAKSIDHKNYLGETAYVPFNIQILRKKVQQKLHTPIFRNLRQTYCIS